MNPKSEDGRQRTPSYKEEDGECVIPGAIPVEALGDYVLTRDRGGADDIRAYLELQAPDETVKHLEKVASEPLYGDRMDAWDVRTDKNRWWVITNPTNLYSQDLFPSLDYTMSFHVGLMTRVAQAESTEQQEDAHDQVNQLTDRVVRARAALYEAEAVEEFQAVGVKCREALLQLTNRLADEDLVIAGQEAPKGADFVGWSEIIANHIAAGEPNQRLRSYLKAISRSTWQLANWLAHSTHVGRLDGSIVVEATDNVVSSFLTAWIRAQKSEDPGRPSMQST